MLLSFSDTNTKIKNKPKKKRKNRYLAPELLLGEPYDKAVDWFAFGCLISDLITGTPPYPNASDPLSMLRDMLAQGLRLPKYISTSSRDLMQKLLAIKPMERLGSSNDGAKKIREHSWFDQFDWESLRNGSMKSPLAQHIRPVQFEQFYDNAQELIAYEELEMNEEDDDKPAKQKKSFELPVELQNWIAQF